MGHLPDDPENELLLGVIPYEYASEIASIVSGWAMSEYEIDGAIWNLAGLDYNPKVGACLTAQYAARETKYHSKGSKERWRVRFDVCYIAPRLIVSTDQVHSSKRAFLICPNMVLRERL
jgi:hypothetical protein